MAGVRRHNRNQTDSGDLSHAVDGYLKFALDHLVDFLLGMEVFVNRRTAPKLVVCECWFPGPAKISGDKALSRLPGLSVVDERPIFQEQGSH